MYAKCRSAGGGDDRVCEALPAGRQHHSGTASAAAGSAGCSAGSAGSRSTSTLERLNYKISRYEEAVRTGVLTWDKQECKGTRKSPPDGLHALREFRYCRNPLPYIKYACGISMQSAKNLTTHLTHKFIQCFPRITNRRNHNVSGKNQCTGRCKETES